MIVAIDANNLAWRVYHTMGGLSHNGQNTGIQYGVLTQALKLVEHYGTTNLVFVWDSRASYRRKFYPQYKAKPKHGDDDEFEKEQRRIVKKEMNQLRNHVLPAIGWKNQLRQVGCEADDLIARLAQMTGPAEDKPIDNTVIISGDDDLMQCIKPSVWIDNPSRGDTMTDEKFQETYGIIPYEWRKVKTIAGCTSDNVPGIPGVGEKTALKFLRNELGHKSKAYINIYRYYIQNSSGFLERNQWLVNLPLPKSKKPELVKDEFDLSALVRICEEKGFNSLLKTAKWDEIREALGE